MSIWSNGEYLESEIMEIVAKCWEYNISVRWYDKSIGEKDLTSRNNIILKKKFDRVYLMIRKNAEHRHLYGLEKRFSEEAKDENRESSFMLIENFDFDVLKTLRKDHSSFKRHSLATH